MSHLSSSCQIVKLEDKINEKKGISLISQLIRKKFSTITKLFVKLSPLHIKNIASCTKYS